MIFMRHVYTKSDQRKETRVGFHLEDVTCLIEKSDMSCQLLNVWYRCVVFVPGNFSPSYVGADREGVAALAPVLKLGRSVLRKKKLFK